jgi:hypothetical protein
MSLDIDIYDFGSDYSQTYKETCENCGEGIQISAQRDKASEYSTVIYVKCECGTSVQFVLPVN